MRRSARRTAHTPTSPFRTDQPILYSRSNRPSRRPKASIQPRIEKTVFLSYRRVNGPWALAIYQDLKKEGYDVFFDFEGIGPGDFESIIVGNILSRAHFLILLTPSALERCDEPGDWLRREIETAIDSHRNIIPLMLESFDFGAPKTADRLTGKLSSLKTFNGIGITLEWFFPAMEKLRTRFLNVPPNPSLIPAHLLVQ